MKMRVTVSIVLLVIAISVSATSYFLITFEVGRLRDSLYDALYTAENGGDSAVKCDAVLTLWEDVSPTLRIFSDDTEFTKLHVSISCLIDYAREQNTPLVCEVCVECIKSLDSIEQGNDLSLSNILKSGLPVTATRF